MRINSRKVKQSAELNPRATVHMALVWHFASREMTVSPLNKSNNSEPNMLVLQEKSPWEYASICCTIVTLNGLAKDPLSFTDQLSHHQQGIKQT